MKLRCFRSSRFTMVDDGIKHDAKYTDTNNDANPENRHVKLIDIMTNGCNTFGEIQSSVCVSRATCGKQSKQGRLYSSHAVSFREFLRLLIYRTKFCSRIITTVCYD